MKLKSDILIKAVSFSTNVGQSEDKSIIISEL